MNAPAVDPGIGKVVGAVYDERGTAILFDYGQRLRPEGGEAIPVLLAVPVELLEEREDCDEKPA